MTTIEPSLSIDQFCKIENISRSLFYKLEKIGKAPRTILLIGTRRITPDDHRAWRKAREAEAAAVA